MPIIKVVEKGSNAEVWNIINYLPCFIYLITDVCFVHHVGKAIVVEGDSEHLPRKPMSFFPFSFFFWLCFCLFVFFLAFFKI